MKFQFIEPELGEIDKKSRQPASYIRKRIFIGSHVKKATLYITALGVYKGYLNGTEIDPQVLLPGFTNYRARVQYQSYNVTDKLIPGENVIAAVVGDGWYRGSLGIQSKRNVYGSKVGFAAILEVEDENGVRRIETDETWKASQEGMVRINDLKTYEIVDRRMENIGWDSIGFDDNSWHGCVKCEYTGCTVPHEGESILEHERFPAKLLCTPDGSTILDFGQNLSGHVEFTVTGKAGTKVSLTMGETLDENGNFTLKNLYAEGGSFLSGELGQQLIYTLKEGTQTYKSLFLISGYRFVKLDNWPEEIKAENFSSIAIYSDLKAAGDFSCSNAMVNQLVSNVRWSQRSNFVDIPTDCPTRERAGWTGDINVFSETALYMTDAKQFLLKWLHDFITLQNPNGGLPYIVPEIPLSHMPDSSAGWSDAIANIPMILYRFYGDKEILSEAYDTVKRFVDFDIKRAKKRNILHLFITGKHFRYVLDTGFHWGEWLEPGSVMTNDAIKAIFFPDSEVATAWLYHTTKQLSQMAEILGKEEDATHYASLSEQIRAAYKTEFLKNGKVESTRQCRYVRPVSMGLVEQKEAAAIVSTLNQMCIHNNYRIGTGFLTTYKLLPVLCDYGYAETAYKILENTECPGWLYEVKKGATTTWENWLGIDEKGVPKDSQNHYAPGSVVAWLFSYCAGIKPLEPGFSKIQIKPVPGGSLTWAKASYESCKGRIVSDWSIENGQFRLHVEIPEEVNAEIILPSGLIQEKVGGIYEFECAI